MHYMHMHIFINSKIQSYEVICWNDLNSQSDDYIYLMTKIITRYTSITLCVI